MVATVGPDRAWGSYRLPPKLMRLNSDILAVLSSDPLAMIELDVKSAVTVDLEEH